MGASSTKTLPVSALEEIYKNTRDLTQINVKYDDKIFCYRFDIPDVGNVTPGDITSGIATSGEILSGLLTMINGNTRMNFVVTIGDLRAKLSELGARSDWINEFIFTLNATILLRTWQRVEIVADFYELIVLGGALYVCKLSTDMRQIIIKRVVHGVTTVVEFNDIRASDRIPGWEWVKNRIIFALAKYCLTTVGASTHPRIFRIDQHAIEITWTHGKITAKHNCISESYAELYCAAMPAEYERILKSIPIFDWTILACELDRIGPITGPIVEHTIEGARYRMTPNYVLVHDTDEFLWARLDEPTYRMIPITREELRVLLRERESLNAGPIPAVVAIIDAIRALDNLPWKQLDENPYQYLRTSINAPGDSIFGLT